MKPGKGNKLANDRKHMPIECVTFKEFSDALGVGAEMFLDRTDLSKTVDRQGMELCHVPSRASRFFRDVLVERQPVLAKND